MGADQWRNDEVGEEVEECRWPVWLKPLLRQSFFGQCGVHIHSHKSECNMFCLDCSDSPPLCSICCNSDHQHHRVIQIRRSSYHDVIRASEIQKVLDIGGVQTYIINSARIVFLNQRPQPRAGKGVTNTCLVCHRSLLDTFSFCSLGCKIAGTSRDFQGSKMPVKIFSLSPPSSAGSGGGDKRLKAEEMQHLSFSPSTPPPTSVNYKTTKRRKGIPHRAPFGVLIA